MTITNFRTNPEQLKRAHGAREAGKKLRPTYVRNSGEIKKRGQELPIEVVESFAMANAMGVRNDYIHALSKAGWTGTAIARACKLSREGVRQILRDTKQEGELAPTMSVPEAPKHPKREPITFTEPTPEMLSRLKELQPIASKVRSNSPRYRAEAEEFSFLLNEATQQGVTVYRLAKLLGITPSAIAFRLVRYGYRKTQYGETKAYKTIRPENRRINGETKTM